MIEKAATLAEARGWDFDIVSPVHLALAIPSLRWGIIITRISIARSTVALGVLCYTQRSRS